MKAWWLTAVLVAAAASARAQGADASPTQGGAAPQPLRPGAQERMDRGRRLFETQQYGPAIDEFRAGYLIDPDPHFLYSIGQAERLRGDCKGALEAYRAFLRTGPPPAEEEVARFNVVRCEETLVAAEERRRSAQAHLDARRGDPTAAEERRPWYTDPLGGILTGLGVAALAGGVVFLVTAEDHVTEANRAATEEAWSAERDEADRARLIGVIGVAAGGALIIAGVLRYAVTVRTAPRLVSGAAPAGAIVVVEGSF